ncbi:hypothetical protein BZG36_02692 [Bifiguratus adelaidae]|uniref:Uncharacterized protein n=1 Tax=Bifiguratus adelaidae TaxID=1938954 RepID=A0A261Y1S3_9FUNG|nr:hypothetical protein BZG36_02692 [Bifiguratus adelaidae]
METTLQERPHSSQSLDAIEQQAEIARLNSRLLESTQSLRHLRKRLLAKTSELHDLLRDLESISGNIEGLEKETERIESTLADLGCDVPEISQLASKAKQGYSSRPNSQQSNYVTWNLLRSTSSSSYGTTEDAEERLDSLELSEPINSQTVTPSCIARPSSAAGVYQRSPPSKSTKVGVQGIDKLLRDIDDLVQELEIDRREFRINLGENFNDPAELSRILENLKVARPLYASIRHQVKRRQILRRGVDSGKQAADVENITQKIKVALVQWQRYTGCKTMRVDGVDILAKLQREAPKDVKGANNPSSDEPPSPSPSNVRRYNIISGIRPPEARTNGMNSLRSPPLSPAPTPPMPSVRSLRRLSTMIPPPAPITLLPSKTMTTTTVGQSQAAGEFSAAADSHKTGPSPIHSVSSTRLPSDNTSPKRSSFTFSRGLKSRSNTVTSNDSKSSIKRNSRDV